MRRPRGSGRRRRTGGGGSGAPARRKGWSGAAIGPGLGGVLGGSGGQNSLPAGRGMESGGTEPKGRVGTWPDRRCTQLRQTASGSRPAR